MGLAISYSNQQYISSIAKPGETITLYAQWLAPYTIHFDANGGEGEMIDQTIIYNTYTNLAANSFTAPNDYYFNGWNTETDGSGTGYNDKANVRNIANGGETITLYAQWVRCFSGKICYKANGDDVVGTMGEQSASNNQSITLYASNFSRSGYGFAGWNTKADYSGNFYGPNQNITAPVDVFTNGLSLYAVWVPSAGSLQSNAATVCDGLAQAPTNGTANLSSVSALTDERDNQTYAIAKLADGKCWMIENLRLENTGAHNTDGALSQGYNSSFIGLANPESTNFDTSGTANSLYSTDGSTTAPAITGSRTGYRFPRYNNNNTNSRQSISSYSTDGNTYSMGNYYTWAAAIADTTYHDVNNESVETTSICPTGWHLPRGGEMNTTADFYTLGKTLMDNQEMEQASASAGGYDYYRDTINIAGDTATEAFRKYPNNFLYSGIISDSLKMDRGSSGYYLSSTVSYYNNPYVLLLSKYYVVPGTFGEFGYKGIAIRCMLGS